MEPLSDFIQVLPDLGNLFWLIPKTINAVVIKEVTHAMELIIAFIAVILAGLTYWATRENLKKTERMLKIAEKSIEKADKSIALAEKAVAFTHPNIKLTCISEEDAFTIRVQNLGSVPLFLSAVSINTNPRSEWSSYRFEDSENQYPLAPKDHKNFKIQVSRLKQGGIYGSTLGPINISMIIRNIESIRILDNNGNSVHTLPDHDLKNYKNWLEDQAKK